MVRNRVGIRYVFEGNRWDWEDLGRFQSHLLFCRSNIPAPTLRSQLGSFSPVTFISNRRDCRAKLTSEIQLVCEALSQVWPGVLSGLLNLLYYLGSSFLQLYSYYWIFVRCVYEHNASEFSIVLCCTLVQPWAFIPGEEVCGLDKQDPHFRRSLDRFRLYDTNRSTIMKRTISGRGCRNRRSEMAAGLIQLFKQSTKKKNLLNQNL